MRKKVIITLITFLLSCFTLFLFGNTAYASSQKLNSIYYETSLNSDGTADIVETWDISVYDTNTLFKTFDLDSSKYGDITNVKVEEILEDGSISNFIKTNEYEDYSINKKSKTERNKISITIRNI